MAITVGLYYTCALLPNGTAKCWGNNGAGQLGDGTTTQRTTPVHILSYNLGGRFDKIGGLTTIPIPIPTTSDIYFLRKFASTEPTIGEAGAQESSTSGGVKFYTNDNYNTETSSYTLSAGLATIYAKDERAETITLTATDESDNSITSGAIVVNAAAHSAYAITTHNAQFAGAGWTETIKAVDANGNLASSVNETVTLSATKSDSGTASVLFYTDGTYTTTTTTATLSSGTATIYAKDNATETFTITATDSSEKSGSSGNITVSSSTSGISTYTITTTTPQSAGTAGPSRSRPLM
ncbi:MAG: RCC1 domain-containing protein, partial [Candidatus Paceibacterota bacterium]